MADDLLKTEYIDSDDFAQTARAMTLVMSAIELDDRAGLLSALDPLHPADVADIIEQMNATDRRRLIGLYGHKFDGDVLSELDESLREEVIDAMTPRALAEAVRDLESDDVVDLIEDLAGEQRDAVINALDDPDRTAVYQAFNYPEYSAGRLMQREFVVAPEHWTVGETLDYLRKADDLPEQFYHVTLVDPRMRPIANVTLGRIISASRGVTLKDIEEETFRVIRADADEADVAYAFNQYHLISAPVVDDEGRIIGLITIDDAMAVLDEEAEEDIMRLAGVGEGSLSDKVFETVKQRFTWLFVNLVTAILASLVIAQFEETITALVALAVLMPIVASMGGNAGTQSLTVAVRAIATRDLTSANVMRVIRREVLVGLVNGIVFALVMGGVGILWFGTFALGYVIALAMVINLVVAGLAGTLIPVVLDRLKIDPALASGAFVTTVTDVVGFFAFLGLASWILI